MAGFTLGQFAAIYEWTPLVIRSRLMPLRIQEHLVYHEQEIDAALAYAPTLGMAMGLGLAFLVLYLFREQTTSPATC